MLAAGEQGVTRDRRIAGTALLIKTLLHRLYYDVDFGVERHPSEDPPFYAALAEFEQRAGLAVDGVFSSKEFDQLEFLSV